MTHSRVRIRSDRVLEVDGRPFFPLQARHIPAGGSLESLAGCGFNCFRHLVFGHLRERAGKALPEQRFGLKLCAYLFNRTNLQAHPSHLDELTRAVEQLKDDPDLLAYETYNEPAWRPDSPEVVHQSAEDLTSGYRLIKKLDPNHPVHIGHGIGGTIEALREYNAAADIIGCNSYPVFPAHMRRHIGFRHDGRALDSPDQTISAVGDYTRKMVEVGEGRKPVWMQVQAMAWEEFYSPSWDYGTGPNGKDDSAILFPTYEEMRFMAFDDIIHGASGLLFSLKAVPLDQPVWQDIKRLVLELRQLHDILAGQTIELDLRARYRNLGFSVWKGVRTLVKDCNGRRYLLAANNSFDPAEVTWTGFASTKILEVLGEGRNVKVRNELATDRFDPFGVHVYAFT